MDSPGKRRWQALAVLGVAGEIAAAAAVAGIALATSSTGTDNSPTPTTVLPAPGIAVGLSTQPGVALQDAIVDVVHSVSPSVVQIEDQRGLGSGIVLDEDGDIVTNNHVVSGGKSWTITTSNGARYPATLVGSFPPDDLAVIKIPGGQVKPATFADSSRLQVETLRSRSETPWGCGRV